MDEKYPEFTPVMKWITKEVGPTLALVYGAVARHCRQWHGVCTASIRTMAEETGLSSKTIWRSLKTLKANGMIVDRTPDRAKATHELLSVSEDDWRSEQWRRQNDKSVDTESIDGSIESVDMVSQSVDMVSQSVDFLSQSVDTVSNKESIRDNQERRGETPSSQKNANPGLAQAPNHVESSKEDNVRNYIPGPANYTNGDPVKAYRNMARVRISAESETLIAESVTDVPAWESVLRGAKMAKLDLADVPELLTQYTSCGAATVTK